MSEYFSFDGTCFLALRGLEFYIPFEVRTKLRNQKKDIYLLFIIATLILLLVISWLQKILQILELHGIRG